MTGCHARGLRKSYQGRRVLDLDASFAAGKLHALLGPNGSGKSTLLRLLALIEPPDRGEVVYLDAGKVLTPDLALRRRVVLAPDRKGLFNETVFANAGYGLRLRKTARGEQAARVEEALRAVGLWELRGANALSLSTGEAQRLCLAMALAVQPAAILLDEPTSSLDPPNVALAETIIRRMMERARLVVLVTHDVHQARRLADRVLLLHQGRLVEEGPAGAFFATPRTDLARRFLAGDIVCERLE